MSSATLLTKIFLFLMHVRIVHSPRHTARQDQCIWVCDDEVDRAEEAVKTHYFKFSTRTHQDCADDTTVKSWDLITVGIIVARDVDNPREFSFSDFLTFGIEHVSLRQFVFGNKNTDLESVNSSVSCLLQPTSNETGRVTSNGLHVLYSPLFYYKNRSTNSQETPYVGYVEIGGTFYVSAGFTDSTMLEYRFKFDQWDLTLIRHLSIVLVVVFTLFIPSSLTSFCANIKTKTTNEAEANPSSKATGSPTDQGELTEVVDGPRVNPSDHGISSSSENLDASEKSIKRPVPTEQEELKETRPDRFLPWTNDYLESSTAAAEHNALGIGTRLPNQENTSSDHGHSEMAGLLRPRSAGTRGHGASQSSSNREEIEPICNTKPQNGVQHQNIKYTKLDSVEVMDLEVPASPVGLRSFIANKVFSNSKSLSLPWQFVKFVILIIFPPIIPILVDVFVLLIPRLFPRIASNLPSPFLTKFVFIFTYDICPVLMYCSLPCYIFRVGCFCFRQSSSSWVRSFLDRKHFVCFWKSNYIRQLVFPNSSFSACDECKKAPKVEIPVNIKNNLGYIFSLEIFCKNVKDLYQWWQGNEEASVCRSLGKWVLLFLSRVGLFCLFIALSAMDIIASLPAISLCYGKVWFLLDWADSFQFGYLIGEFLVIFFSIVWIVCFSVCCSMSVALAVLMFYIAGVNYPVEILLSVACYIMVGLIFWTCYCDFFSDYEKLLRKLTKICRKEYASELNDYKEGDEINIPWKLFTSACDKFRLRERSVRKLWFHFLVLVFILVVFSFAMGSNTGISASTVLAAIVTVLLCLWALLSRSKQKEWNDEVFQDKLKHHVDAFFKGKLD